MNNTPLQLTIREMTQFTTPRFLAGLLGVICILTISAPFNTAEVFNGIQRFFYWGAIATSTCFLAIFLETYTSRKLESYQFSQLKRRIISSIVVALFVALLVCFINFTIVGINEFHWASALLLGGECMLISFAVTSIFYIVADGKKETNIPMDTTSTIPPTEPEDKPLPPFFQRLPDTLGTDIISLRAQDHYVEVTTTQGRELVLIRLTDAIKELGSDLGIQTHRSWWVVRKHVIEQKRISGKPHLVLSNANEVPVSRTYSAAVKEILTD